VILAALICKLRLKKKIFPFNYARCDRSPHCSPDSLFDIVLTLIRRTESAETGGNRLQRQRLSTVLLPSGTINYRWHSHAPEISSSGSSHESEYLEGTVGKQENWVEAEIRCQSAEARRAVRQDRAKPAVAALKTWLMERLAEVSGKSVTAGASRLLIIRCCSPQAPGRPFEGNSLLSHRALRGIRQLLRDPGQWP
jgi:hypothetical protein